MKALYSIALIGALATGQAYAACTYPAQPDKLPDGATATREEMLGGKKTVTEFDNAIGAYNTCLQKEADEAIAKLASDDKERDKKKAEIQKMADQKHNAAVEADEQIASRFNEQLRAYNAKQKEKK
ncbi:MAG: hypothetical protein WDO68_21125 [Gammaproteobacteria bacterium]